MRKKKKSLIGWVWKCEFNKVFKKQDGDILIDDGFSPQTTSARLEQGNCGCGGNHPKQKIKITIEEL